MPHGAARGALATRSGAQLYCLTFESNRASLSIAGTIADAHVFSIRAASVTALPWMANARPDELDDERVAVAAAAGAVLVKVGVDTGSARLVEHLGKSPDGAGWIRSAETAFARLDRHGIASVALFMVGMPDEGPEDARATLALARRIRPDYLQMQLYRAYPDVPMWGTLPEAARTRRAEYHHLAAASNCSRIPAGELAALQRRLYRAFYLRPGFVVRHWHHYLSRGGAAAVPAALRYLLRG